ncbi:oxidoreductase [Lysobacter enzymogenes]|uniref:oxidoreductase n=1 Tax=Lysobacter enzymogenes TaxID=69 RepID=UPI001AFADBB8|nr:oxidoreductase [Lysobacter enzymogenes]QQP99401.1 oxidoreductase [Lysobacter enzymogenes]
MSEPTPLRVALIGYGFAGKTFHAPLIAATPGLELAVVGSSDAAKVGADLPAVAVVADPLQAATDARAELVVIATPNHSHAPLARAAMAAGKHVVVDKPFTLNLAEARELAALAQRHDRLLSVFQNRRWDSDYLGIKQAVESGRLGAIAHFESHIDRFRPQVRERWREQAGPGTGVWWDLGPHLADQALQLFGPPERVFASLALQREGAVVADWAHVVLEYPRLRAILHAGMLAAGGSPRFLVHGSSGSLLKAHADRQEAQLLAGLTPGAPGWGEDPDPLHWFGPARAEHWPTPAGDQRGYYAAVRDAIRGQGLNPVPPEQAVALMAVLEAAAESAAQGRAIAPDLSEAERAAADEMRLWRAELRASSLAQR